MRLWWFEVMRLLVEAECGELLGRLCLGASSWVRRRTRFHEAWHQYLGSGMYDMRIVLSESMEE